MDIEKLAREFAEVWLPVVGYENLYRVSSYGRVKREGKIIKQATVGRGYKRISLSKNGKASNAFVHRLVLMAFVNNPLNKPCCNHKDKNPSNNYVHNLEWCTHSENEIHSRKNGKVVWNKGKIMNEKYRKICSLRAKRKIISKEQRRKMAIGIKNSWVQRKKLQSQLKELDSSKKQMEGK